MCPLCIGSALLWLGCTGSAGGLAAMTMGVVARRKKSSPHHATPQQPSEPRKLQVASAHSARHHDARP